MSGNDGLWGFIVHISLLSLLAIGGVNTILPELHRFVVLDNLWMSNEQFTALFALAQAAPGPNVIFVTLIGWQIFGLIGALAATLAICGPATIIAYVATHLSTQWQHLRWFKLLRSGLVPLTTGLMITSAWLLTAASAQSSLGYVITAATACVVLMTRINPLWLLAVAAVAGVAGFV
ncbi:chromate transporter [Microvirga sp. ACRRW]|uniref:chromate transporter n=1 Tax=Microvirga sp. ACRRW TaxID=2918205 RepID=UPI001EF6A37D|nr:chromate transporter [Microvirga sp. ACRRW]MCG7391617.1 chromate transporter [Microvirga sp. ACRRW]